MAPKRRARSAAPRAARAKQPRHFHAGPERPGPPAELRRDELHCVYDFLTLHELALGPARCSREWSAAAGSLKRRAEQLSLDYRRLLPLFTSSLRHRVSSLDCSSVEKPSCELLLLLCQNLLSLRSLVCAVDVSAKEAAGLPFRFPAQLQSLSVALSATPPSQSDFSFAAGGSLLEGLLRDVAAACPALRVLRAHMCVKPAVHHVVALPPSTLQSLLLLRGTLAEFELQWNHAKNAGLWTFDWHQAHIDVFRALTALTRLDIGNGDWREAELKMLTAAPAPALLQFIGLQATALTSRMGSLLARLPALTELQPAVIEDDPSFLVQMPQLRSVKLHCEAGVDAALLMAALSRCNQITSLSLEHAQVNDGHLCQVLPSLPLLSRLELIQMDALFSLRCLSHTAHLSRTLSELSLRRCTLLHPVELHHLHSLSSLITLSLDHSFSAPLDGYSLGHLDPASQAFVKRDWPMLNTFTYEPPEPPEEEEEEEQDSEPEEEEDEDE